MKQKLSWFCTFLLFFWFSYAKMSYFNDLHRANLSTIQCLKANGYLDEVFVVAYYQSNNHTWDSMDLLQDCNKTGTIPHVILDLLINWSLTTPESEANYFNKQFSSVPLKMIWLQLPQVTKYNITCSIV